MGLLAEMLKDLSHITLLTTKTVTKGVVIVPMAISGVTTPIFATIALYQWYQHRSLYRHTLNSEGTRAAFGHTEEQSYMSWDGKAVTTIEAPQEEPLKEEAADHDQEANALDSQESVAPIDTNPFRTLPDLAWLEIELSRKKVEETLTKTLARLRFCAKLFIPIVGVPWALGTEHFSLVFAPITITIEEDNAPLTWKRGIEHQIWILSRKLSPPKT